MAVGERGMEGPGPGSQEVPQSKEAWSERAKFGTLLPPGHIRRAGSGQGSTSSGKGS